MRRVRTVGDHVADILAAVTDSELLAAIRRGDVTLLGDSRLVAGLSYWARDNVMRAEARRRNIL